MNENKWKSRWTNEQIHSLLNEQFDGFWLRDIGIKRTKLEMMEKSASLPHAVIVSGLRRVGKSTLLAQMAHKLGKEAFYYINFEDDRFLGFSAEDVNDLHMSLVEIFGERRIFIVDEIQNVSGWEHFVRRFIEAGFKFYISGSNAFMLSQELGTRLTGRYIPIELFPFSFGEYLKFNRYLEPNAKNNSFVDQANLSRIFNQYLISGGIPETLKYPELPLIRSLYEDILYRDIAARYRLDALTALKELAYFVISNPASLVSFNKLKEQLKLGSVNTIKNYLDYMQQSWLVFAVNSFSYSVKKQQVAPKKIYCIDNGIINTIGFHFSPNTGKLLENLVFLTLRQQFKDIFYYSTKSGFEVDFYIPSQQQLIQVSQRFQNPETRKREVRALVEAGQELDIKNVTILCDEDGKDETCNDVLIKTKAVTNWLLNF